MHKLVFEEGGLPDGTEVAYYARGQVCMNFTKKLLFFFMCIAILLLYSDGQKLLEGYKKGFGIFCRCCNSEVFPLDPYLVCL